MESNWVSRVNAKIAAMEFMSKETVADEIADVVSAEIVNELAGVPDEDIKSVIRTALHRVPDSSTPPPPPPPEEDDEATGDPDDDMPGLISNDYCELHRMMEVAASEEAYNKICDTIDDLYEQADRQDKDLEVEQDEKGLTLLHWALLFRCPSIVVQTLINAYPDIETYTEKEDCLPLHYAARYSMSLDVVEDVYSVYPSAILKLNDVGIPPALIARYGGAPKEIVEFLEERMRNTKAHMKAAAAAAAAAEKAAAAEEEEDEEDDEVDEEIDITSTIRENANTFDAFLLLLCWVGVMLFAVMFANAKSS
jgi:hypothetical protein